MSYNFWCSGWSLSGERVWND